MSRTSYVLLAACLPVGGLFALAANGNHYAKEITYVGLAAVTASVGWAGPKAVIELKQDAVQRGRHRRASSMAERPRTEAAEPYRGVQQEDDLERTGEEPVLAEELPPSYVSAYGSADEVTHRLAAIEQELDATQQIARVDPYLDPAPNPATRLDLLDVRPDDRTKAAIFDELSARGVWNLPVAPARSVVS